MKKIFTFAMMLLVSSGPQTQAAMLFTRAATSAQGYGMILKKARRWTVQDGSTGANAPARAVATDSSANIYVTGSTTVAIDGQTQHGGTDLFITKYSVAGVRQWTIQDGATGGDTEGWGIAVDSSANIYVTGFTSMAIDGQTQHGTDDFFISKYNSSGVWQWTVQNGSVAGTTKGYGITVDSSGYVCVAGSTTAALDSQTLHGGTDLFLTRYNSSGVRQWTVQDGVASKSTVAQAVTTDSSGYFTITGYTTGALDSQTLHGADDVFISRYSSAGSLQWTVQDGAAAGVTSGTAITTDSSNNIYVAGGASVAIDSQTLVGSSENMFITKYSSSGVRTWTVLDGSSSGNALAKGIVLDTVGNVWASGYAGGSLDSQTAHGGNDLFLTKYSSTGSRKLTLQDGTSGATTIVYGLAVDTFGNLNIVGYTTSGIDGKTQHGNNDLFITQYF